MQQRICAIAIVFMGLKLMAEEPKVAVPLAAPVTAPAPAPVAAPALSPVVAPASSAPVAPKPPTAPVNLPRPQDPGWSAFLDRMRIQPRAGEVINGSVNATLADIFADSGETKTKALVVSAEYEKALLEKAAKWESELKELRAQYEAKMIAELPDSKRETAAKIIELSRAKWSEATERDAKTRKEFMERMRSGAHPQPAQNPVTAHVQPGAKPNLPAQPGADATAWMRDERIRALKQDTETTAALRAALSPDDAARFDLFNRSRPMPPPIAPAKPANPIPTPAPAPSVPVPVETKKDIPQDKK